MRRLSQSERIGAVGATLWSPTGGRVAISTRSPPLVPSPVRPTCRTAARHALRLWRPTGLMHITDGQNERVRVAQSHLILIVSCCEDTYPCNGPTSVSCSALAVMARRAPLLS